MKIALVSYPLEDNSGGVERFSNQLFSYLKNDGHEIILISPKESQSNKILSKILYNLFLSNKWKKVKINKKISRINPDLVISQGFFDVSAPKKHIHVYHGTMVHSLERLKNTSELSRRRFFIDYKTFTSAEKSAGKDSVNITVSNNVKKEVEERYHNKVEYVIPNAIDTNIFKPRQKDSAKKYFSLEPSDKHVLFVGRIEQRKAATLPELISEFEKYGIKVINAGNKPIKGSKYLGVLSEKDVAIAYNAADCVIFPTYYEGFGFILIEAMGSKIPIVTSNTGYIPELLSAVPSYEKLIKEPDDIKGTVDIVREIIEKPEKFSNTVNDLYEFVEKNCTSAVHQKKWLDTIKETMDR